MNSKKNRPKWVYILLYSPIWIPILYFLINLLSLYRINQIKEIRHIASSQLMSMPEEEIEKVLGPASKIRKTKNRNSYQYCADFDIFCEPSIIIYSQNGIVVDVFFNSWD